MTEIQRHNRRSTDKPMVEIRNARDVGALILHAARAKAKDIIDKAECESVNIATLKEQLEAETVCAVGWATACRQEESQLKDTQYRLEEQIEIHHDLQSQVDSYKAQTQDMLAIIEKQNKRVAQADAMINALDSEPPTDCAYHPVFFAGVNEE